MKQKILDILDNYFADDALIAEIKAVLDSGDSVLPGMFGMLDVKAVSQQDIHDWATLHGYVLIKVNSLADRVKMEKAARDINSKMLE